MKNTNITSILGAIGLTSLACVGASYAQAPAAPGQIPAAPTIKLSPEKVAEISSYMLGYQQGQRLGSNGLAAQDVNTTAMNKGFLEGLKADTPTFSDEEIRSAMTTLGNTIQERAAKVGATNQAASDAFLKKNGERKEVTTTASGLQYEVINKGTDKKYVAPANGAADSGTQFLVNYRGSLIDGTEFDKSPEGQPVMFPLQRIIPGFQEALTTMPVGAKWKLFIPSSLAYGPRGSAPKIGPNCALVFELELVSIQAAAPAPAPVPVPRVAPPARPKASATTAPVQVPTPKPTKKSETAE